MKIDIETRIPLESGKIYYACEGDDEYTYKPCPICNGTGKIEVKGRPFRCPECLGENSNAYEVREHKIKWKVAKYYLESLSFDKDGNVTHANLKGINVNNLYLSTGKNTTSLLDMEIYSGKIYDDYGEVLREVKRRNKEENEKKE